LKLQRREGIRGAESSDPKFTYFSARLMRLSLERVRRVFCGSICSNSIAAVIWSIEKPRMLNKVMAAGGPTSMVLNDEMLYF
jgi:hypothetical protein